MIAREFNRLHHPFADRHRRYDDDKLGEPKTLVQLVDSTQVNIGLAGAGLHFDVEVPSGKTIRGNILDRLHALDILRQPLIIDGQMVSAPTARRTNRLPAR